MQIEDTVPGSCKSGCGCTGVWTANEQAAESGHLAQYEVVGAEGFVLLRRRGHGLHINAFNQFSMIAYTLQCIEMHWHMLCGSKTLQRRASMTCWNWFQ